MNFKHLVYCDAEGPRADESPHARALVMVAWHELAVVPKSYGSADEHGGRMLRDGAGNTIACGVCGAPMRRRCNITDETIASLPGGH